MSFLLFILTPFLFLQQEEPATGPIINNLIERIEKRTTKIQLEIENLKVLLNEAMSGDLTQRGTLLQAIEEARAERRSLASSLGIIKELREAIKEIRLENKQARAELRAAIKKNLEETQSLMGKWTPLQNLMDRIIGLLWKVLYAFGLLAIIVIVIAAVLVRSWSKVKDLVV